jgi:predicted nucleic acid-binding protein
MILVDTSVFIDFFKGVNNKPANKFRGVLQQNIPFGLTAYIFQEILQGAKSELEYTRLKKYLELQIFYHPKEPINSFSKAARIYFQCRKKGITIRSTIDCMIVQTAIEYDLFLLHNDKDFKAIKKVANIKEY